jgi:ribosomal protein L35
MLCTAFPVSPVVLHWCFVCFEIMFILLFHIYLTISVFDTTAPPLCVSATMSFVYVSIRRTLHSPFSSTPTQLSLTLLSTARHFIISLPRHLSSSATLGYPELKTHSGSKKRLRALPPGAFKRLGRAGSPFQRHPFFTSQAHSDHSQLNVTKRPGRKCVFKPITNGQTQEADVIQQRGHPMPW